MSDSPLQEQECQQDMLRLLQKLQDMLEKHVDVLHREPGEMNMKPAECEQALDRHITLMLRVMQVRQQFVQAERKTTEQHLLDSMLYEESDPERA